MLTLLITCLGLLIMEPRPVLFMLEMYCPDDRTVELTIFSNPLEYHSGRAVGSCLT